MAIESQGLTITFGTSSWTAELTSVNQNDVSREALDTTHLGTTTAKTFIPTELFDGGNLEVEFLHEVDEQPPYSGAAETITVTFPKEAAGSSVANSVQFSGFMTNYSWGAPMGELVTGSATIKVTGDLTWVDES